MTNSLIDLPTTGKPRGFSLLETAVVLVVFGLLAGGIVKTLGAQHEQARIGEARAQLASIREALIGFALVYGRLPCPATPELPANDNQAGLEALVCIADCPSGHLTCPREHGVVPWQTLGVAATDPWGNRLTYFVDRDFSKPLSPDDMTAGLRSHIRLDSAGRANIQERFGTNTLSGIPVLIVSHGPRALGAYTSNGLQHPGATGDEAENADSDLTFIAHPPDDSFDDVLTWLPTTILKNRLVSVGKLP